MIIDGDNKLRHCAFADDSSAGTFVTHPDGGILSVVTYKAMLEAAPQPPKLSDERIREIWIEHGLDDEDVEGFARAIEREILGG